MDLQSYVSVTRGMWAVNMKPSNRGHENSGLDSVFPLSSGVI